MDIYEEVVRLRRLGQKCALATIVQVNGSIPSYESAKLLVREDGSMLGTIGGGWKPKSGTWRAMSCKVSGRAT
jgi:xanthine dehydrogenase accessory factor